MSNAQRGFWTFLFSTLVGPFFAALGTAVALPILIVQQLGPFAGPGFGVLEATAPFTMQDVFGFSAITAIRAYVWAAIPAGISGLLLAIIIWRGWPSGWGMAGSIGVVGFMIAVIAMPFSHGGLLAYIAVFAGFVAIACRAIIVRAGVLAAGD